MIEAASVFAVQGGYIFLLGLQSRNVFRQDYVRAACTSLLLGVCGLFLTSMIAIAAVRDGSWLLWSCYVVAGPLGVCTALWVDSRRDHRKMTAQVSPLVMEHATAKERKATPIATGVLDYFPLAITAVAHCSWKGNEQHNPGQPLHWDRSKSGDEADALMRHFVQRGTVDSDGIRHSTKVAWRALAMLQKELEHANSCD